ncbi:MAG: tRNA uridine-5-carboxymethylaminomethyl(34) synthesis enzyme MnmG [Clostridia bacterium]|nr:tRNA uridine-5-carboxymethylaminomethyl(34) synthesis enzyme MnmG [Clostridia bacterium]
MDPRKTSVIVIGAGHAGVEAALAPARLGLDTVLFTLSLDAVANMPCNPSIGGTAKGHIVFEIDALGGEMGRAADEVTIQSRTLNLGKGAAVQSKRVQADRVLYRSVMKKTIERTKNLRLIQDEVTEILTEETNGKKRIKGIRTSLGEVWECDAVIVATGTYLEGQIFIGDTVKDSGPDGMLPAKGLSASLAAEGIRLQRFKTGTPARVNRRSIDFSKLEEQKGEEYITPYSVLTDEEKLNSIDQLSCHIVYTNADTHRIIKENIHRSAMYSGNIHGIGPRYCPSIEDKIVRFADKERHQLFVEPMGLDTDEMYIQGFSTSLPVDVQHLMLSSLSGFENAEIMRYAYAIEYDCADPTQLKHTLEFRDVDGLYGAGQFNGTSGYEEAAAQGLIAGINAAMKILGKNEVTLLRSDGYIGTLIDDLVSKGTKEPYRMMTSRSEFRLLLRQDNADVRLTKIGYDCGLISEERYNAFLQKQALVEEEKRRLSETALVGKEVNPYLESIGELPLSRQNKLADLLRRPSLDYDTIAPIDKNRPILPRAVTVTAANDIKYEGYIKKQLAEVKRLKRTEELHIPEGIDYKSISGLRLEGAQKLDKFKPSTIGEASRISGVSPADISVLLIYLKLKGDS